MQNVFGIILVILVAQIALTGQAQNKKEKRLQAKHLSSFETQILDGDQLPVMMPYNRWIDPAGEQIYFGDAELEKQIKMWRAFPGETPKLTPKRGQRARVPFRFLILTMESC